MTGSIARSGRCSRQRSPAPDSGWTWAAGVSLLAILALSLGLRLWYAQINPLSYDETHNLMIGVFANQGYAPYRDIYSVIAPFALLTIELSTRLWGTTGSVRNLMIGYGLAGVAALFYLVLSSLSTRTGSKGAQERTPHYALLAASAAAVFFSFNPGYFFVSSSINLEAGAVALSLLSLVAAERYSRSARRVWILISGILFGLCATFKILVPYLPALIALQVLLDDPIQIGFPPRTRRAYRKVFSLALLWLTGVLCVLVIFLLVFDRTALIQQVFESRFELRSAIETGNGSDTDEVNIAEAVEAADLLPYTFLAAGALAGFIGLRRWQIGQRWIWLAWLVLGGLFLLSHNPVRPRHLVTLLPPLAALSGAGLVYVCHLLWRNRRTMSVWLNPLLSTTLIGAAIAGPYFALEVEDFVHRHPARQPVLDFVRQTTLPEDCLISKENRLHFLAERLSTPDLSLISTARLFSGLLPATRIIHEARTHHCPVLVYAETFDQLIPDLRTLAAQLYALRLSIVDPREPDHAIDVYTVMLETDRAPTLPLDYRLGDHIHIRGADLTPGPWQAGQRVQVASYWQAQQWPSQDYKIFLHLLDEDGNLVQAYDHYPFEDDPIYQIDDVALNPVLLAGNSDLPRAYPATGLIPTQQWPPGQTLREVHTLTLPSDLAPGDYVLVTGLYDEGAMARLPVTGGDARPGQDWIYLTTAPVQ